MNDEFLINKEDLETIDSNIEYLSNNLNVVNENINQMEGRLNQVSNEFNSLQQNIKETVLETQRNTMLLNAKQTIMLLNQEYDRKYRYRDDVRRKVKGLIQAADINKLKRETIEMIGLESIVNSPDYWLTSALLALCSWYTNDRESAYNYLNEALKRDPETTALLLCFIHIRANRLSTATNWLNRYLSMQNPTSIDGKIVLIIEAIGSGIFNNEMQSICFNTFEEWTKVLNSQPEYKNQQVKRWQEKFISYGKQQAKEKYAYIDKFVINKEDYINHLNQINSIGEIFNDFNKIINKKQEKYNTKVEIIDKLLDTLIYNFDSEEWQLHSSIEMNNYIIKCNGDVESAKYLYQKDSNILNQYSDFYTHITNIALTNDDEKYLVNTKKIAFAYSKDIILSSYKSITNSTNDLEDLIIKLDNYQVTTKDGSNERELIYNIYKMIDQDFHDDIYKPKLINNKNILTFIAAIFIIIFCNKYLLLLLIGLLCIAFYNIFSILKIYNERKKKISQVDNIKTQYIIGLLNVVAEIVDSKFEKEDNLDKNNQIISFLNNLDYRNYFGKTIDNEHRNILKEGN